MGCRRFWVLVLGLAAAAGALVGLAAPAQVSPVRVEIPPRALLAAEDLRPTTRDEALPILAALGGPSPALVRRAVLALGRLENPLFVPDIRLVLADPDADVRAEAIHALGHASGGDPGVVLPVMRERMAVEKVPAVRGVMFETLGRLAYRTPDERAAVEPLLRQALSREAPLAERVGAAEGIDALIRGGRNTTYRTAAATLDALRDAVRQSGSPAPGLDAARLRRLALGTLNAAGAVDDIHARAMLDGDEQVRRLAVAGVGRDDAGAELRASTVARGLTDESAMVRYEALRVHGRHLAAETCAAELEALNDPSVHVALLAADLLGTTCPKNVEATKALTALVTGFGVRDSGFEDEPGSVPASIQYELRQRAETSESRSRSKPVSSGSSTESRIPNPESRSLAPSPRSLLLPSHALVSLARRDGDPARKALAGFAAHPYWLVRMAAARAAAVLADAVTLERLATDTDDNVREAAIGGLSGVEGHDADAMYLAALQRPAYQVVLAASQALAGTPAKERAAPVLVAALAALTARKQDTSRDARAALLTRLEETGGPAQVEALKPYLADDDPEIAALAARLLSAWTGTEHAPATTRVTTLPLPPQDELDRLPTGMRVVMSGGGSFDVRFDTWDATVTVWRIARLVQGGYYNGLTFHRVVPNFVIQGGSPGANEFVGDGPFMRDACGPRSNLRYSIGVSTRGRDTGDAQFYLNLVDNERLDHQYPVFGEVVRGTAVIDAIAEGDVMVRIELLWGQVFP